MTDNSNDKPPEEWRMIQYDYEGSDMFTRISWQDFGEKLYRGPEFGIQKTIQEEWDVAARNGSFIKIETEEWRMIQYDYEASGMFTRKRWQEFAEKWYRCTEPRKQKVIQAEWDHAAVSGRFIAIQQPEE